MRAVPSGKGAVALFLLRVWRVFFLLAVPLSLENGGQINHCFWLLRVRRKSTLGETPWLGLGLSPCRNAATINCFYFSFASSFFPLQNYRSPSCDHGLQSSIDI